MNRLTRLLRRPGPEPEPVPYICSRCGQDVARLTPEDEVRVNEHRLLHLAKEWGDSLEGSTGWIVDDDGGLRPVSD